MAVTNYYWDELSDNVFLEEDESGQPIAEYAQEPSLYGELIAQQRDGQTSICHFDGRGSTRALTDENQNITDTATYTAFGEEVAKTGSTTNPFGYKGALGYYTNTVTGDIYVRARTYAPKIGRWRSRDRLLFVDGENLYLYGDNSPAAYADPSGMIRIRYQYGRNYECGQVAAARFTFWLSNASPCDGFLVQRIVVSCEVDRTCNRCNEILDDEDPPRI